MTEPRFISVDYHSPEGEIESEPCLVHCHEGTVTLHMDDGSRLVFIENDLWQALLRDSKEAA